MKKIILLFVIILAISCNSYKNVEIATKKRYRYFNPMWDGVSTKHVANTFENHYRYNFNNRFLDDGYLLCYFLSFTEIKDSIPPYLLSEFKHILDKYKKSKLISIKIQTIQSYIPRLEDKIPRYCEQEIKENNENFQNYLNGKYKSNFKHLFMVVSEDEMIKIKSSVDNMSLNLSQYELLFNDKWRHLSKDTAISMINFYYGEYDLSKLRPYEYEIRHYDSISKIYREKEK